MRGKVIQGLGHFTVPQTARAAEPEVSCVSNGEAAQLLCATAPHLQRRDTKIV